MRRSLALWMLLATLAGIPLFLIKHEVQDREARLDRIHREIVENQEAIQVLKAEWSYLNRPSRIEALVRRHIEMVPATRVQLVGIDALPTPHEAGERPVVPSATPAPSVQAEVKLPPKVAPKGAGVPVKHKPATEVPTVPAPDPKVAPAAPSAPAFIIDPRALTQSASLTAGGAQ